MNSPTKHPLYPVLIAAINQANNGKGERHGGAATSFYEQPWAHTAKIHGNGFLTGQATKKLGESVGKEDQKAKVREILGGIVYAGMAILHELGLPDLPSEYFNDAGELYFKDKHEIKILAENKQLIYLAGPMTGLPDFNYPAFNEAAKLLRELGYEVLNPAEFPEQKTYEDYLRYALHKMHERELYGVVLLPGWEKSKGANTELSSIKHLSAKVFEIHDNQLFQLNKGSLWETY